MLKFRFLSSSKMLNKNTYHKRGNILATEVKTGNGEGTKKKRENGNIIEKTMEGEWTDIPY